MNYVILEYRTRTDLVNEVNKYLGLGYAPSGGVSIYTEPPSDRGLGLTTVTYYAQAMVQGV